MARIQPPPGLRRRVRGSARRRRAGRARAARPGCPHGARRIRERMLSARAAAHWAAAGISAL